MGLSIVDRVGKLFSSAKNFDISGFAYSELVSDELQYDLGHLSEKDRKSLKKLGYEFKWFNADMTEGLIFIWIVEKPKKIFYTRRLYFNGKEDKNGRKRPEAASVDSGTNRS